MNKKTIGLGRNALGYEKGLLDAKISKLKDHINMQDIPDGNQRRFFESKDNKLNKYAKIINKKQNALKQEYLTDGEKAIKDFLIKANLENIFHILKNNGFDDMEILLDIKDSHLDSMEIVPQDQLNLFKALRYYKENMGKQERIIDTRKKNTGNSDTQSTNMDAFSNNKRESTMESDKEMSFNTINLDKTHALRPQDSLNTINTEMTISLNNTAYNNKPGSSKNVPNKMKMGNKVILKPLETQDDCSKTNDLLSVVGKKPNSQCQMERQNFKSNSNDKSSMGLQMQNQSQSKKNLNNNKFVIKRPPSRDISSANNNNQAINDPNIDSQNKKPPINSRSKLHNSNYNPYGYNQNDSNSTAKPKTPQIPKNNNKKSVGVEAEMCAEVTVKKGSCWKCYRQFDMSRALYLENVLKQIESTAEVNVRGSRNSDKKIKWQPNNNKIFCSPNCLDDEVKKCCKVCIKCHKTFLRTEGKGIYCSVKCSPCHEEMAMEMNHLMKGDENYDQILEIIDHDSIAISKNESQKTGILRTSMGSDQESSIGSVKRKKPKTVSFDPETKDFNIDSRNKSFTKEVLNPYPGKNPLSFIKSKEVTQCKEPSNRITNDSKELIQGENTRKREEHTPERIIVTKKVQTPCQNVKQETPKKNSAKIIIEKPDINLQPTVVPIIGSPRNRSYKTENMPNKVCELSPRPNAIKINNKSFTPNTQEHSFNTKEQSITTSTDNSSRNDIDLEDSIAHKGYIDRNQHDALRNYKDKYEFGREEKKYHLKKKIMEDIDINKGFVIKEEVDNELTWEIKPWDEDQPCCIFESGEFVPYDKVID